jgi:catechol 2,3-dioxygenase
MALIHRGVQRLGYVRIAVDDPGLTRTRAFYEEELGLLRDPAGGADALYRCWHEPYRFTLAVTHSPLPALMEIGLQVRDDVDLELFESRAARGGIPCARDHGVLPGVGRSVAFTLPAGPRVRLFAEMEQPGYVTGYRSPHWVTPRALRGMPAPLHLNHVAVTSPDVPACVDFLVGTLGFVVSEKIVDNGGALRSALLFRMSKNIGGQDIAVFPGAAVGLHHIAFTKEDASDILADGYHLRSDGVEIDALGPLRQPYGNTFSLYFRDSNRVRLELCSGGRMTEPHPDFRPVVWSARNINRALSYYDEDVADEFLLPCL